MKYTITILLLMSLAMSAFATNDKDSKENNSKPATVVYSGNVIDSETGESLTGVKINVPELGIDTYTDFDGNFEFSGSPNQDYTISVSYISYKEKNITSKEKSVKVSLDAIDN